MKVRRRIVADSEKPSAGSGTPFPDRLGRWKRPSALIFVIVPGAIAVGRMG